MPEEAKEAADSARLIPSYNEDAEVPSEVYPLHNIIPEAEWKAISISAITSASSNGERIALLPYRRSDWVNGHLNSLFAASSLNKRNLYVFIVIPADGTNIATEKSFIIYQQCYNSGTQRSNKLKRTQWRRR